MKIDTETKYNFYPEHITQVMAEQELIFEDEILEMQMFIRGYA